MRAHPEFRAQIDRDAIARLLRHGYVGAPLSIYSGIRKLGPGMLLAVAAADASEEAVRLEPWWRMDQIVAQALEAPISVSEDEAVERLDAVLRRAVAERMEADVPLGAFLSGGIDSSTVVAMMQAQSTSPVKTFAIGFREFGYDEAPHAEAVAKHLGTDHTEYYVSAAEARQVITRLPELYDEPFADPSQIPTFLVSQLARRHVTVSLSGDGGDELFCGYDRYAFMDRLWRRIRWCPRPARRVLGGLACALARLGGPGRLARKLGTAAEYASVAGPPDLYARFHGHWRKPDALVIGAGPVQPAFVLPSGALTFRRFFDHMMFVDLLTYLPDDILVKVDRASMAVGLEARVPLLDHRVVEFAWRVPLGMKRRARRTKWLLRRVLERYVPPRLTDRPKMGFGVPIGAWLRGPLRAWADALLAPDRLRREGFLHPEPIQATWQEHLAGRRDWQYLLWDVLMFQAWLERYHGN